MTTNDALLSNLKVISSTYSIPPTSLGLKSELLTTHRLLGDVCTLPTSVGSEYSTKLTQCNIGATTNAIGHIIHEMKGLWRLTKTASYVMDDKTATS